MGEVRDDTTRLADRAYGSLVTTANYTRTRTQSVVKVVKRELIF